MAQPEPDSLPRRACAAVIRNGRILMVRHRHGEREFWTLPGGGVEPGETAEQAALRELREETGLTGTIARPLYTRREGKFWTSCFQVAVEGGAAALGHDPELAPHEQVLVDCRWFDLTDVAEDMQVSEVLRLLAL